MHGRVRAEPPQRLDALSFLSDRPSAVALVRRDDDVDEPLEEITLLRSARAPREPGSTKWSRNRLCSSGRGN
jgi:hypothetical protein